MLNLPNEVPDAARWLRAWLEGSLCPKARSSLVFRISLRELRELEQDQSQARGMATLQAFLESRQTGRSVLIVESEQDGRDHHEARDLAQHLFTRLLETLALLDRGADHIEEVLDRVLLLSRLTQEPPILLWQDTSFITIAMGPHYPPQHPRWAPRLCLVVTWSEDVVTARSILEYVVRQVAEQTAGRVYDFKELYIMPGEGV